MVFNQQILPSYEHSLTMFNVTFNNISAISWRPALVVEEAEENHRPWASN
jgi:hypothetical protein